MKYEEISLINSQGYSFKIDLRYEGNKLFFDNQKLIVICPGFLAYKDWGPFPYIGEKLCNDEFATIVMNYSHNGIDDNRFKITNLKKFSQNTISKELDDIQTVLNWVNDMFFDKGKQIFLIGHSRGAADAIICSTYNTISGLITISPIANYDRWNDKQKSLWREKGYLPASNDNFELGLKISIEYLNDLEKNKNNYDIINKARLVNIPWLIIHGENDLVASMDEVKILYENSNQEKTELVIIPEMGHLLGYKQFTNHNENIILNKVLNIITTWLNKNFRRLNGKQGTNKSIYFS